MRSVLFARRCLPLLLAAFVVASAGCGSRGNVAGKVTFKGKPMPGGSVIFFSANGVGGGSATINPVDGTYSMANLPVGELKATVQPFGQAGVAPGMGNSGMDKAPKNMGPPKDVGYPPGMSAKNFELKPTAAKHVPIPYQYTKADTSGLSVTIKAGTTTFNIDIP